MAGLDRNVLEFLFVGPLFSVFKQLNAIERRQKDMATQADIDALAVRVNAVGSQQLKALDEIVKAVADLKQQIQDNANSANLDLSQLDSAVTSAADGAAQLDNINPDLVLEDPPVEEPPVEEGQG